METKGHPGAAVVPYRAMRLLDSLDSLTSADAYGLEPDVLHTTRG